MKKYVVHCKKENYDVFIGRPSEFGNPFIIGKDGTRAEVIEKYRQWVYNQPDLIEKIKQQLKGKILGCFCAPEFDCHGYILSNIANAIIDEEFI